MNTTFSSKPLFPACLLLTLLLPAHADNTGKWIPLFDGKTLNGWTSLDLSFWAVKDGAITGETTKEHNPKKLLFIVSDVRAANFELKFKYRLIGAQANSGMQFRSR